MGAPGGATFWCPLKILVPPTCFTTLKIQAVVVSKITLFFDGGQKTAFGTTKSIREIPTHLQQRFAWNFGAHPMGGVPGQKTQKQIDSKNFRDVTQLVRGAPGDSGEGDAGVHPGGLPGGEARASTLGVSQGIVRDRPAWRDRPATAMQTFHFNI